MASFAITTDNNGDLPFDYLEAHDVGLMSLTYTIEGQTYDAFHPMPDQEFYQKMRDGAMPTTAQVNPETAGAVLREALKQHDGVLHIAFSSGLSGSCQSAMLAAAELREEFPDKQIVVIDSLSASLGQGLLVDDAVRMRDAGCSFAQTAAWCEENKLHIGHLFTVDDLFHLYRGGRVSRTKAFIGSALNMKPILHVDNEGKLIPIGKVRGRKRALDELVRRMETQIGDAYDSIAFISHGDCVADALYVRDQIVEKLGLKESRIHFVGPSIGAHSGPGTVALFFHAVTR